MRRASHSFLVLCLFLAGSHLHASETSAAALQRLADAVGTREARQALVGISARAEANGPRGAFASEMISLNDGTARFRLLMAEGGTELLLAADRPYTRSLTGTSRELAAATDRSLASFVRGHEVHRMLLDLELRFRPDSRAVEPGCQALLGPDDLAVTICRATDSALPATIELALPAGLGGGSTRIELGNWRGLHGVQLPFAADFLHAGELHTYRYTEVLPFRLAPGVELPSGATAPDTLFARLGDLAALASAHERTLAAHRQSDVRLLLADAAERSVVSGRGTLRETGRSELAARLSPYLEGIRFSRYEDVVVPVVAVSADGTLGWLACQIEAAGSSRVAKLADGSPEPIAYGFSWVELYARNEERWQAIGNASSPLP